MSTSSTPGNAPDGSTDSTCEWARGDAEVGARRRVGVLVAGRVAVLGAEHLPPRPLTAHPLALDRPGAVSREDDPVVLVGLVDDAAGVVLDEVARDVQVMADQVGDAVGGHLVGDRVD